MFIQSMYLKIWGRETQHSSQWKGKEYPGGWDVIASLCLEAVLEFGSIIRSGNYELVTVWHKNREFKNSTATVEQDKTREKSCKQCFTCQTKHIKVDNKESLQNTHCVLLTTNDYFLNLPTLDAIAISTKCPKRIKSWLLWKRQFTFQCVHNIGKKIIDIILMWAGMKFDSAKHYQIWWNIYAVPK